MVYETGGVNMMDFAKAQLGPQIQLYIVISVLNVLRVSLEEENNITAVETRKKLEWPP